MPSRYLYPSQPGRLNVVHNVLAVGWVGDAARGSSTACPITHVLRATAGGAGPAVDLASLFFPAFYMVASWAVSV